jgi:hypothetical protein
MPSDDKVAQLIRILIRTTVNGDLKWTYGTIPRTLARGTDDIIEDYFEADYREQTVAVFERRYRTLDIDREEMIWTQLDFFALVAGGAIIWETADSSLPIAALHNVARNSAADIDNVLDKLLK